MLSTAVLSLGVLMLLFAGGLLMRGGTRGPASDQVRSSARWLLRAAIGVVILAVITSFLGN
jgi:hypothetical protein